MGLAWDDLRIALAIARNGTLGRAGAALGLDATTVGRRLAAIHAQLGQPLFERTDLGLAPTAAGRHVIADLEAMELAALATERKLAAVPSVAGQVRIAVTDAFATGILLDVLRALPDELPAIEIELVAANAIVDLRRREADLALRFARPAAGDLRGRKLGAVRWSLYGATRYLAHRPRVDPERGLDGHRLIRWRGLAPIEQWLDDHGGSATVVLRTAQLQLAIEACKRGFGLCAIPGSIALSHGLVRVIDHSINDTELWLVVHRDLRKVPRVRAVVEWLAARLGSASESLRAI